MTSEATSEVTPEVASEVTSEVTTEVTPEVASEVPRRSVVFIAEETVEEARVTSAVSASGSFLMEDEEAEETPPCSDVTLASVLS